MKPNLDTRKPAMRKRRFTKHSFTTLLLKKDGSLNELAALLIQVICICILVGCAVGLLTRWYLTDNQSKLTPQATLSAEDFHRQATEYGQNSEDRTLRMNSQTRHNEDIRNVPQEYEHGHNGVGGYDNTRGQVGESGYGNVAKPSLGRRRQDDYGRQGYPRPERAEGYRRREEEYGRRPPPPFRRQPQGYGLQQHHYPPEQQNIQRTSPRRPAAATAIYAIPDAMDHVGDKSARYARLRQDFDHRQLFDAPRLYSLSARAMNAGHNQHATYDIHNCPDEPPKGYPYEWNLVDILNDWNPNVVEPPNQIYQGLCIFDYEEDYEKALTYRDAELPFVVQNDPEAAKTAARWNAPGYVDLMAGREQYHVEYSEDNHFMYWNMHEAPKKGEATKRRRMTAPEGWKQPTKMIRMSYREWLSHANVTDDQLGPDKPHWYFRMTGCGESISENSCDIVPAEFLFDELPYFQPRESLYLVEPDRQMGIHCRFGMKGVIAESHFDVARNAITVLGGERRYVLSHPNQCGNLALYPEGHPSCRHSAVDWTNPDLDEFPEFAQATGNEVVLQPGDVMYLPTNWFHFIVSLSLNFQCNTRSGTTHEYMEPLKDCGFDFRRPRHE